MIVSYNVLISVSFVSGHEWGNRRSRGGMNECVVE